MVSPASSILLAVTLLAAPVLADTGRPVLPSTTPEATVTLETPEVGIPFGCGMSFPVSQVHNVGSHVGNDTWAWDFRMPEGTPVVAALEGVVRLARGDSDEGGCDPAMARKANYVVIESPGNIETQYLHFTSVSVVPGQHVHRGELLGYSGKTGWACGAHLHFKVATPVSAGWNNPSVEARLQGYGDPVLEAWVSSPPCTAPLEVATHQPPPAVRQADPVAQVPGDVHPAAQSAAGSAGQAAISAGSQATSEARGPGEGPVAGPSVQTEPIESPPQRDGVPFLPSTHAQGSGASLDLGPSATAPAPSVARPGDASGASAPRDPEEELLDAAPVEDASAAPATRH